MSWAAWKLRLQLHLSCFSHGRNLSHRWACFNMFSTLAYLTNLLCDVPVSKSWRGSMGSQHPSPNVKTLCNLEPQTWPEKITSRDAESTCFKGSRTSCDVICLSFWGQILAGKDHIHVMDASCRFNDWIDLILAVPEDVFLQMPQSRHWHKKCRFTRFVFQIHLDVLFLTDDCLSLILFCNKLSGRGQGYHCQMPTSDLTDKRLDACTKESQAPHNLLEPNINSFLGSKTEIRAIIRNCGEEIPCPTPQITYFSKGWGAQYAPGPQVPPPHDPFTEEV